MIYPAPLRSGDTIGLIAPSSPISPKRLYECIETIYAKGYQPVIGESAEKNLHGYLAGSDEIRANDINCMFKNPDIQAIFCLRGGYGSTRIMDLLDYEMIKHNPKIFLGYSDITSFHLAFYSLCNLSTFHGPMVSSNMVDDFDSYTQYSFEQEMQVLENTDFFNPIGHSMQFLVPGTATGRIIGGCLSLVSPSIGTFYQPDFKDTILFLEDIDESLPRCDKLMQHLKNSHILSQVNGIILGNFKGCINPNDTSYTMYDFFCDFFKHYNKPVLWGLQSGHAKPMATIPFGAYCSINSTQQDIFFQKS